MSPGGIPLSAPAKTLLLVLLLGILWLRVRRRKRSHDKFCGHCGHRNPAHRASCAGCSAPLFTKR